MARRGGQRADAARGPGAQTAPARGRSVGGTIVTWVPTAGRLEAGEVPGQELQRLLGLWREAELRWEATSADDVAIVDARREVLLAWEAYNRAAGTVQPDEIVLVADDSMTYVEAFGPTDATLGWTNAELIGRRIADLTPIDQLALMDESWRAFVMAGRLEGTYRLRTATGQVREARFAARSHYPVAGLHVSRIRLVDANVGLDRDPTG